jgi:2,3-bisphosphoglycerate-independent phosphoglycerate mutase
MSSDSNVKYIVLVPDGMADGPVAELGGMTPVKSAKTPWMDRMSAAGDVGLTRTIPEGMEPGSDVANLSIMGYSPREVYTGRAPFEAASMGVYLHPNDLAFRLNFVTLERNYTLMADHSADHISTPEAQELIAYLSPEFEDLGLAIYHGVSYRNLMVWRDGPDGCVTHAPHDFPGHPVDRRFPTGPGADVLIRLILKSWKLLEEHPVNRRRIKRCQGPANSVWPWGQGRPPRIKSYQERFGITGAVVAAVDLIRGIGKCAGLESVDVTGATGYLDTNYQGKVDAALKALDGMDFVFLHVEAPDEASHSGQLDLKIKAIEDFDEKVAGPLLSGLNKFPRWRLLLMPDHHTPISTRVHSADPVPFILLDSEKWKPSGKKSGAGFSEEAAAATGKVIDDTTKMVEILLEREKL